MGCLSLPRKKKINVEKIKEYTSLIWWSCERALDEDRDPSIALKRIMDLSNKISQLCDFSEETKK